MGKAHIFIERSLVYSLLLRYGENGVVLWNCRESSMHYIVSTLFFKCESHPRGAPWLRNISVFGCSISKEQKILILKAGGMWPTERRLLRRKGSPWAAEQREESCFILRLASARAKTEELYWLIDSEPVFICLGWFLFFWETGHLKLSNSIWFLMVKTSIHLQSKHFFSLEKSVSGPSKSHKWKANIYPWSLEKTVMALKSEHRHCTLAKIRGQICTSINQENIHSTQKI